MSGHRRNIPMSEVEYSALHEAEMRVRFLQPLTTEQAALLQKHGRLQSLDGTTAVVLQEQRLPARTVRQWETGLFNYRLAPVTIPVIDPPVVTVNSLGMPPDALHAMRPVPAPATAQAGVNLLAAAAASLRQEKWESELVEAAAPRPLPAPAVPPARYQRAARNLVARLEKIGFVIHSYDPEQHAITLQRADGSAVRILSGQLPPIHTERPAQYAMQTRPINQPVRSLA